MLGVRRSVWGTPGLRARDARAAQLSASLNLLESRLPPLRARLAKVKTVREAFSCSLARRRALPCPLRRLRARFPAQPLAVLVSTGERGSRDGASGGGAKPGCGQENTRLKLARTVRTESRLLVRSQGKTNLKNNRPKSIVSSSKYVKSCRWRNTQ